MIPPGDPVRAAARAGPKTVALMEPGTDRRLDYRTLNTRVDDLAAGLADEGVDRGARVVIEGALDAAVVELIHAVGRLGATVVPIDPNLPPDRLRARLDRIDPTTIVTVGDESAWNGEVEAVRIADIRGRGTPIPDALVGGLEPADTAAILFTSGTTGRPKAVRLTTRNLAVGAVASALRLGLDPRDRWYQCLAPHHMGGFATISRAARYGTGIVVQPFDPPALTRSIDDAAVTGISLVPTMLRHCLDERVPLEQLRVVLAGGDRTPPALVERALDRGFPLHVTYGMTETTSQVATATPAELADQPKTVGRPLRWTRVQITDEHGDPVERGSEGEIHVHGPTVSPGYLGESDGALAHAGEWFRTADRGHLDGEGYLYVSGRADERIITGGVTVDPRVVEAALTAHEAIEAAVVVGIPDAEWGERVCALLEVGPGEPVDPDAIVGEFAKDLSPAERPRIVDRTATLPRTPSGTVDRARVRAQFEERDS